MVIVVCVNGINIIVPATVGKDGRMRARVNRARILAAVGLPEHACVRWGF